MSTKLPVLSRLSRSVWRVLGCNPSSMTLQGTNVYLVGREESRILIDAGPKGFPQYVSALKKLLKQERTTVERIILTHWHKDHVGGLEDLVPLFEEIGKFPTVHKFLRTDQPDDPIPEKYEFHQLNDGERFSLGPGCNIDTLFTPGHSTDHASLYFREEATIFCGDCLLGEGTGLFEDLYDYINSLTKLQSFNPYKICPGHGPVIDDSKGHISYNIDHQLAREKRVYGILQQAIPSALSATDIVGQFYKGLSPSLQKQAVTNINHHLKKLVRERKIEESSGRYKVAMRM